MMAVPAKVSSLEYYPVWGVDVARFGDDRTALAKRQANRLLEPIKHWTPRGTWCEGRESTVEDVNAARAEFARAMDRMQRGGYSINDVLLALFDCLAINIAAVGNLVGADEQQRLIKWAVDTLPRMVADRAEVYGSRQRQA